MGRFAAIIIFLTASLFVSAEVLTGYSTVDSVTSRLERLPLCPIEGVWQMAADGAVFAIERETLSATETMPRRLRLTIIRSPHRRVRSGSVMGTARPTVKPGVYEATINTRIAGSGGLELPRRFLLTLNADGTALTMEPYKSPIKVNLLRLLPYLYRIVRVQDSRPHGLDGAVRIYPLPAVNPLTPVYL